MQVMEINRAINFFYNTRSCHGQGKESIHD